jgi:prepilin peptidase CpaA
MLGQPNLSGTGEILLGILVAIAAVYDVRYRRIPNWLVLAGLVAGLAWNTLSSGGLRLGDPGLLRSAEGLGLGFILYFPLYLIRGRRAGDVKLLAAAGSITGPGNCFWLFLLTAVLGGLIALVVIALHKRVGKTFFNVGWIVKDLLHFKAPYKSSEELDVTTNKGLRVPHAAMMAVGAAAFILMARYGVTI